MLRTYGRRLKQRLEKAPNEEAKTGLEEVFKIIGRYLERDLVEGQREMIIKTFESMEFKMSPLSERIPGLEEWFKPAASSPVVQSEQVDLPFGPVELEEKKEDMIKETQIDEVKDEEIQEEIEEEAKEGPKFFKVAKPGAI